MQNQMDAEAMELLATSRKGKEIYRVETIARDYPDGDLTRPVLIKFDMHVLAQDAREAIKLIERLYTDEAELLYVVSARPMSIEAETILNMQEIEQKDDPPTPLKAV